MMSAPQTRRTFVIVCNFGPLHIFIVFFLCGQLPTVCAMYILRLDCADTVCKED